jgi:hypothetical protein
VLLGIGVLLSPVEAAAGGGEAALGAFVAAAEGSSRMGTISIVAHGKKLFSFLCSSS